MLAQANPFAHSEIVAIGSLHGVAPGPLVIFEAYEGAQLVGTPRFPFVGTIDNQGDTEDVVIGFAGSATKTGSYVAVQMRVNGTLVNTVTVPPKGRVQFSIDACLPASPFLRLSNTGLGFGRVGLHSFVGRLIRREA